MKSQTISIYAFSSKALVDGARIPLDSVHQAARAVLGSGHVLVPAGFFKQLEGVRVSQRGKTIQLERADVAVTLTEGSDVCRVNEEERALPVAPRREKKLMYLPVVATAQALRLNAKAWDLLAVIGDQNEIDRLDHDEKMRTALAQSTLGVYNAAYFTRADFAKARECWREDLCGSASLNNPSVSGMKRLLELRDEDSEDLRRQMNREPDAPILFGTEPPVESRELKQQYDRILRMAQPYGTYGCRGYKDKTLLKDIVFALDWMHDHMYGAKVLSDESYRSYKVFNWWEWYVGGACPMLNTVMIIERDIPRALVRKYVLPMEFIRTQSRVGLDNSLYMSQILPLIPLSLLTEDRALLQAMYLAMNALLQKHETGNCMRSDWCCMTHGLPYNICYGLCNLVRVAKLLRILSGSPLAFSCLEAYNLMYMVRYTFAPVLFDGQGANMMNGRYMQDPASSLATQVLSGLHNIYGLFGEEEDREIQRIIRRNATQEVREGLIGHYDKHMTLEDYRKINVVAEHTQQPKTDIASYALNVQAFDGDLGVMEPYKLGYMWASGDCAVQHRGDYCFMLRMSSERLGGYESINSANGDAWYTGDGMLYLYTKGYAQYDAPWWEGTDKYHMPGVTADTQERLNCSIGYGKEYKNERDFVGGVALDRMYLTTAMDFRSFHCEVDLHLPDVGYGRSQPLHHCTLEGKKAWFMLEHGALAMGCDVNAQDGFEVHTTVDNRLLPAGAGPVTVDGKPLEPIDGQRVFPGAKTLHLPGVGGYVFVEPTDLTVCFAHKEQGLFVTCWINHGVSPKAASYAYVVLPLASDEETQRRARDLGIDILSNTPALQAARERDSGLCGMVFRTAGSCAGVAAEHPMIVMTRAGSDGSLSLAASDPTQKREALALTVKDVKTVEAGPNVTAVPEAEDIHLDINCKDAHGRAFTAVFSTAKS